MGIPGAVDLQVPRTECEMIQSWIASGVATAQPPARRSLRSSTTFLFRGKSGEPLWEAKLKATKGHFKWSDWEQVKFTQCGVVVEQRLIQGSARQTQLHALLGGLSWHTQQVAPYLAVEVELLLTEVTRSAVDTMIHTNMLLARAKLKQSYKMKIHSFTPEAKIMFVVWVDAANGNRMNGSSTHGIFVGATTENIMQWDVYDVTPCPVPQSKDRQILPLTRSGGGTGGRQRRGRPSTRFQWCEMLYGKPNLHHPDKTVKLVNGSVVTDSMQECLRQAGNRSPGDQRG